MRRVGGELVEDPSHDSSTLSVTNSSMAQSLHADLGDNTTPT